MSIPLSKPIYIYKRFRVKRASDGGSTTVSVDPVLVVNAVKALGSLATVSRIVREAASTYDESAPGAAKNRSAHVTRTLEAIIKDKAQGGVGVSAESPAQANAEGDGIAEQGSVTA